VLELNHPDIFRAVLENLPTGVYLVDRERRILFWNEGAQKITGYLRQDVVGRFLREHFLTATGAGEQVDADPFEPINAVFRDGKASITKASILHKEGYRLPVVLQTIPIRNSHGEVIVAVESFDVNPSTPDRRRREAAILRQEDLDAMLGIPSQVYMEAHLAENLANLASRRVPFAILTVEVGRMDHFLKSFGAGVVAPILRVIAHAIENSVRPADLLGRWSENQFMVVLEGCKEGMVERAGNRIRRMIGDSQFEWWGDTFPVEASLGGADARPEDTPEQLVGRAEKSLLESIAAGGNRVTVQK
jgi:diguanylate cyclase (GGDEF)-like protein/PAS domain S-box-containing protein